MWEIIDVAVPNNSRLDMQRIAKGDIARAIAF
jgi:hypothetical protein